MNTTDPNELPQPTGDLTAAERALLGSGDLGAIAATLLNLLAEVAVLSERVRALEAASVANGSNVQPSAVDDLVRRVVSPLARR